MECNQLMFSTQTDSAPLGDIDLFKCTSLENAPGKKGHGIDLHVRTVLINRSPSECGRRGTY